MGSVFSFMRRIVAHERATPLFSYPFFLLRVLRCRLRYRRHVSACRRKLACGGKLKVLFLVSNCSKWKAQSLYEELAKDNRFEPILGVTFCDAELQLTDEQLQARIDADIAYYEALGDRWTLLCDVHARRVLDPAALAPDLVFFPVPWGLLGSQNVFPVSAHALTCYIPYALECFDQVRWSRRFDFNHLAYFQQLMWAFFVVSEDYADYIRAPHMSFERSGGVLGLGHTALDVYHEVDEDDGYTIYAPHFSFPWNGVNPILNHATFQWSGKSILAYAKRHPEMRWAFKPHPLLRSRLVENGFMTKTEVDAYYADWECLGRVCYDGGYADLFNSSRAMITDSGSFLLEFMPSGKPLIRLEPKDFNMKFSRPYRDLLSSFYTCRDEGALMEALDFVLERHEDPLRMRRLTAAREAGLFAHNAAVEIRGYFLRMFQE